MAGEVGGWPCPAADHEPDNSQAGTLEHKASVRAILQQLTEEARSGVKTSLKVHANRMVTIEDLLRAARSGDPLVVKVLHQAAEYLGRTICQINLLLNPEQIIIAGPLTELDEAFLTPIRAVVDRLTPQLHGRVPRIEASQTGEFGGALGAAALAMHHWSPTR